MDVSVERGLTRVRAGQPGDLDGLERLEEACFDADRLSRRSMRRFLSVATTDVPVAEDGTGLVGYAMIGFRATSPVGRVFSLAVDPHQLRQGIGRALMRACEAAARRRVCTAIRLEVRADNPVAAALYEREGYVRFGRYDDYYEDGTSALRFQKALAPPRS